MGRLADITARREGITSPPWQVRPAEHPFTLLVLGGPGPSLIATAIAGEGLRTSDMKANGEFIAHAPDDIDFLLGELQRVNDILRYVIGVPRGALEGPLK